MVLWTTLVRRHLPRWLAAESASACILAGTFAFAGISAMAMQPSQVQAPTPVVSTQTLIVLPQTPIWPCPAMTLNSGQTVCGRHFWRHDDGQLDGRWVQGGGSLQDQDVPPMPQPPADYLTYTSTNTPATP